MADTKSISPATKRLATKLHKGMTAQQLKEVAGDPGEMVEVPFLHGPYRKAPEIDPYLKAETVSHDIVTYGDVQLPPIRRGVEPGLDLHGNPVDRSVSVIWVSRRQIDAAMDEIRHQHPELDVLLSVVSKWMCHLDTLRSEMGFGVGCAKGWLKGETPNIEVALDCLNKVTGMMGHWDDENRLYLRC